MSVNLLSCLASLDEPERAWMARGCHALAQDPIEASDADHRARIGWDIAGLRGSDLEMLRRVAQEIARTTKEGA